MHFMSVSLKNAVLAVFVVLMGTMIVSAQESTPTVSPVDEDHYQGEGFSVFVPPNATVEEVEAGVTIIAGPDIIVRPENADFTVSGVAYQITLTTFENSEGLTSEAWARETIRSEWQEARDQGQPTGTLPVTEDGELVETETETLSVGDRDAFRVNFFGGDSTIVNLYVAHGNYVTVFSYIENIVENNPLAPLQQDIYALFFESVVFDDME